MDCSKTEVFFKEWRRMCEHHTNNSTIGECLLRSGFGCEQCYSVNAIKIALSGRLKEIQAVVQEWSDQHPKKTRLDVLLEKYPAVKNVERPFVEFCAGTMYGFGCKGECSCEECWNTPIEGE